MMARMIKLLLIACSVISPVLLADTKLAGNTSLVVGVVPQFDAREIQASWQPILDELTKRTGIHLTLSGSPSIPNFETRFQEGEFDLVFLNPYHQIVANRKQGYLPIVKDCSEMLYGILVVPKDSPITQVEQLDGKTIAFPAPNALGAALMMRADLINKFHISFTPLYVKTHPSVYLNTLLGKTSAGGGIARTLSEQPPEITDKLRVLYETERASPHPISVHPRVPKQAALKLQQALLAMGENPAGKKLLAGIPIKEICSAIESDYEPLAHMGLEKVYEAE